MVSITESMLYRLNILNKESARISYQTSTGKILENGSDDSIVYSRHLYSVIAKMNETSILNYMN